MAPLHPDPLLNEGDVQMGCTFVAFPACAPSLNQFPGPSTAFIPSYANSSSIKQRELFTMPTAAEITEFVVRSGTDLSFWQLHSRNIQAVLTWHTEKRVRPPPRQDKS
eukprot:scaffold62817_cov22-Tisochrysis_lutea.AAC.1